MDGGWSIIEGGYELIDRVNEEAEGFYEWSWRDRFILSDFTVFGGLYEGFRCDNTLEAARDGGN